MAKIKSVFASAAQIIRERGEPCQKCDVSCDPNNDGDDDSNAVSDWKEETKDGEPCQKCDVTCDPGQQGDDDSTAVSDWKEET